MGGRLRVVVATANAHKLAEIDEILREAIDRPVDLVARPGELAEVEETGSTLEENAFLKAEAIGGATCMIAIADDTGLFVEALDGAPGVYSARYAGAGATDRDNVDRLLASLAGEYDRRAAFRTVAVAVLPDGTRLAATGEVAGSIAQAPVGDGGFGYDPVFLPDGEGGRSFSELGTTDKHRISHRGRAVRALARALLEYLDGSPPSAS